MTLIETQVNAIQWYVHVPRSKHCIYISTLHDTHHRDKVQTAFKAEMNKYFKGECQSCTLGYEHACDIT